MPGHDRSNHHFGVGFQIASQRECQVVEVNAVLADLTAIIDFGQIRLTTEESSTFLNALVEGKVLQCLQSIEENEGCNGTLCRQQCRCFFDMAFEFVCEVCDIQVCRRLVSQCGGNLHECYNAPSFPGETRRHGNICYYETCEKVWETYNPDSCQLDSVRRSQNLFRF